MVNFCAVANCGSRSTRDNLSFFRFPSIYDNHKKLNSLAVKRRKKWILATHRTDLTESKVNNQRVCSKHFITGKPAKINDIDHPDWIPNVNMGYETPTPSVVRYERRKKRTEKTVTTTTVESTEPASTSSTISNMEVNHSVTEEGPDLNLALLNANRIIYYLPNQLSSYKFRKEDFEVNEKKCMFFTGLPYGVLISIYETVEKYITITPITVLTKFEQLILVLMKLRLNLLFTDLAYRFNISRYTCSRIFFKVLHTLYSKFKSFVYWPQRDCLHATMPSCFKENFGNKVTVIIDCFEIFTQRPINKQAAAQHFSQYKHHNTVKYLIGISPQGSVLFISEGFSGRSSDKFITEQSSFLNNLIPGDLILADRGFLIQDSVKLVMAEVQMPAFLRGKKQLHPREVEDTRKIANVRIHVERVIEQLRKKFNITADIVPVYMLRKKQNNVPAIDKIIHVCCFLINMCPSVVPP